MQFKNCIVWLLIVVPNFLPIYAQVDWGTLTSDQLSKLQDSEFSNITAAQLGSIPTASCTGFISSQISALPASAASGFIAAQVANLPSKYSYDACSGFQSAFMGAMQPAAFGGFTSACIALMKAAALGNWTSDQVASIQAPSCSGFTGDNIVGLNPATFEGFSSAQLQEFTSKYSYDACSGLLPAQISNLPPTSFGGFTSACVGILKAQAFSQISASQLGHLSDAAAGGLTSTVVTNLPAASGAGWTSDNLAGVASRYSYDGCAGFQAAHVAEMLPQTFAGWTQSCVSWLKASTFSQTNALQIGNFSTAGASGMSDQLVANIPPSAASGWTATNLAAVAQRYSYDGCAGFTSAQVSAISLAAFAGWTASCVGLLNPSIFNNISATQMNAFPLTAYSGFNSDQTTRIPDDVLLQITLSNFGSFSSDALSGLSAHRLSILILKYGTSLTNLLTQSQLSDYGFNISNILQFKAMIPNTIAQLYQTIPQNTSWLQLSLSGNVSINYNVSHSNGFKYPTLWGITAAQAPLLSTDMLQTIGSCCGRTDAVCCSFYVLPDTIDALSCDQLAYIKPGYSDMSAESQTALTNRAAQCPNGINSITVATISTHSSFSASSSSSGSSSSSSTSGGHTRMPGKTLALIAVGSLFVLGAL